MNEKSSAYKPKARKLTEKTDAENMPKNGRVAYKTLILLKDGNYSSKIARMLNIPRTTCDGRIRRLYDAGFIKLEVKDGAKFYRLTKKGYEYIRDYRCRLSRYRRESGKTRMHRLNVRFDILQDNSKADFGKAHEMNNWIQKYARITFPIGLTLQKNSDKSIVVMFHEFETEKETTMTDFMNHVMRGTYYAYVMLREKYGIIIDIASATVTDQHIANERPDLDGKLDEKKRSTIGLNRNAKSFFRFNTGAKAWIDYSKGMPEIETNDILYEERLLMMPEKIAQMEEMMKGTIRQQVAISNAINMIAVLLKELVNRK